MAFDTSAMTAHSELISDKLIAKAIANSATANMLIQSQNYQSGVKSSATILKLSADITVQLGDSCDRNPLGNSVFTDEKIFVTPLRVNENVCAKSFYNTVLQSKVSKGQNDEVIDDSVIFAVTEKKIKGIASFNEKLLWNGDTALAGSNPLHYFDGIRKQVKTGGTALVLPTGTTLTMDLKLKEAFLKTNIDIRHDEDFFIFISEQVYDEYLAALSAKQITQPVDSTRVFGTSAKFAVVPGLNGVNEIYLGKLENLQMATDGEDDSESVQIKPNPIGSSMFMDFNWSLGIKVIYPEEFAYLVL